MKSKTVAILTTLGVQLLEVSGSLDVFADAGVQAGTDIYQLRAFSNLPGAIRSSSGVRLMTDAIIGNNLSGKIDTQLVPGAPNLTEASLDARLIGWLRNVIPSVRWYGSICSGAFLLAKAGVLSGQPVTTHGAVADRLAQELGSNTVCPPETGDPSGVVGSKIPRSYEAVDWER